MRSTFFEGSICSNGNGRRVQAILLATKRIACTRLKNMSQPSLEDLLSQLADLCGYKVERPTQAPGNKYAPENGG